MSSALQGDKEYYNLQMTYNNRKTNQIPTELQPTPRQVCRFRDREGHLRATEKQKKGTEDLDKARQNHLQKRSNNKSHNIVHRAGLGTLKPW